MRIERAVELLDDLVLVPRAGRIHLEHFVAEKFGDGVDAACFARAVWARQQQGVRVKLARAALGAVGSGEVRVVVFTLALLILLLLACFLCRPLRLLLGQPGLPDLQPFLEALL